MKGERETKQSLSSVVRRLRVLFVHLKACMYSAHVYLLYVLVCLQSPVAINRRRSWTWNCEEKAMCG
jgi:hypothetical protein